MNDPSREGAKQARRFDPARAARLDDPARFAYLEPASVAAMLELEPGALVVDFGTGTGTYAIALARLQPGARLLALDEQSEMLDCLRAKLVTAGVPNVEPIDPAALEPLHGQVDRILALNVLHELGDFALAELRALLASCGRAVIIDWNGDVERPVGPPPDHVFGVAEARERLERSGLAVRGERLFPYHHAFVTEARR